MTTTITPAVARQIAAGQIKSLARFVSAVTRWFALCDDVNAARRAEQDNPTAENKAAHDAAAARWARGRNPSKASKHHAYDAANQLIALLELPLARPATVADLSAVLAAARQAVK